MVMFRCACARGLFDALTIVQKNSVIVTIR
jgi:hypothetical protein